MYYSYNLMGIHNQVGELAIPHHHITRQEKRVFHPHKHHIFILVY